MDRDGPLCAVDCVDMSGRPPRTYVRYRAHEVQRRRLRRRRRLAGAAALLLTAAAVVGVALAVTHDSPADGGPSTQPGIGLAGQMHSLVCLDQSGAPLRPAIIICANRSKSCWPSPLPV